MVRSATDAKIFQGLEKDTERRRLAKELSLDEKKTWIINVGYHTKQKGIPTLIRAIAKLQKNAVRFFYAC